MLKIAMAAATAMSIQMAIPSIAHADYAAIAVGVGGWAYVEGYSTMEGARSAARRRCQNAGYGSCSTTTAERSWWYYTGGWCNNYSVPYSAASKHGWDSADQLLRQKARRDGYYDCIVEAYE